jgi:hypothetical protein
MSTRPKRLSLDGSRVNNLVWQFGCRAGVEKRNKFKDIKNYFLSIQSNLHPLELLWRIDPLLSEDSVNNDRFWETDP